MSGDDMRLIVYLVWPVVVTLPQLIGVRCAVRANRHVAKSRGLMERAWRWVEAGRRSLVDLRHFHAATRLRVAADLHRKARGMDGCAAIGSLAVALGVGTTFFQEGEVVWGAVLGAMWCGSAICAARSAAHHRMMARTLWRMADELDGDPGEEERIKCTQT